MQLGNTCLWNVLKLVDGQYNESSLPDHKLDTTILPVLSQGSREQDYRNTRLQLLQPPRCNGTGRGVHSIRRSGDKQRSFAHTVPPLTAFPLLLSYVAQKTLNIADNAHISIAVTLGRIMSCYADGGRVLELLSLSLFFSCSLFVCFSLFVLLVCRCFSVCFPLCFSVCSSCFPLFFFVFLCLFFLFSSVFLCLFFLLRHNWTTFSGQGGNRTRHTSTMMLKYGILGTTTRFTLPPEIYAVVFFFGG